MATRYLYMASEQDRIALRFDGSANSYVNVPAATAINNLFTGSISMNFWIRSEATTGTVWSRTVNSSANNNRMILNTSSTNYTYSVILYNTAGTAFTTTTSTTFTLNTWYNITVTYNNGGDRKVRIYQNGTECAYAAQPAMTGTADNDSSAALRIGDIGGTAGLTGKLDEFVIWSTVLTTTYITYLYTPQSLGVGSGNYGDKYTYPYNYLCVLGYHFDENTGTSIGDFIGTNTGTCGSANTWEVGKVYPYGITKYVGHFGNTTANVSSTVTLSSSVTGDFTISAWGKIYSAGNGSDSYLLDLAQNAATGVNIQMASNNHLKVNVDGVNKYDISTSYIDLAWHHFVITRTGTTLEFWIDGTSQGTVSVSATAYPKFFGGNFYSANKAWYGYTDEIGLWTRKITNAEVGDLYNAGKGRYIYPTSTFPSTSTTYATNLLAVWHFDEQGTAAVFPPASDGSGNGNHLVWTNPFNGMWQTSTYGGTTSTGVGGRTSWEVAGNRYYDFGATNTFAGETVHVSKSTDPVTMSSGGNPVNGTFTTNPNGLAQGGLLKTITAATNASPIVCTTAAGHGLSNGDWIHLSGAAGNVGANGMWKVTSVDATHFTLVNSKGTGTWTSGGTFLTVNSRVIPLSQSITYNLPRMKNAFWTMGSGVTLADSVHMKSGMTLYGTVNVAGTQNIIYTDLGGTFDFSSYRYINMDFWVGTAFIERKLGIAFYSNANGTGLISTYYHPGTYGSNNFVKGLIDVGAAGLPSGVKSVGIVSNGALNLGTVYLDTIWFSKPSGADHLNTYSLISPDSATSSAKYYAIDQVLDDSILIGAALGNWVSSNTLHWGYYGSSGTFQLYRREGLKFTNQVNHVDMPGYINVPGTAANNITWAAGYNTSNDTQDGETWIESLQGGVGYIYYINGTSGNYSTINRTHGAWLATGANFAGAPVGCTVSTYATACGSGIYIGGQDHNVTCHAPNNGNGIYLSANNTTLNALTGTEIDVSNCGTNTNGSFYFAGCKNFTINHLIVANENAGQNAIYMANTTAQGKMVGVTAKWCHASTVGSSVTKEVQAGAWDISYGSWLNMSLGAGSSGTFSYLFNVVFDSITATNIGGYLSYGNVGYAWSGCDNVTVRGGSVTGGYYSGVDINTSTINYRNYTNTHTLPWRYNVANCNDGSQVRMEKSAGVFGTDYINTPVGVMQRDTATIAGFKWKYSPTSTYCTASAPLTMDGGKLVVISGRTYNLSCIVQRDSTNVTGRLLISGNQIGGIASDLTVVTSAAANSPETLTISNITPNENGVIAFQLQAYGGTSNNIWFKSVSVS